MSAIEQSDIDKKESEIEQIGDLLKQLKQPEISKASLRDMSDTDRSQLAADLWEELVFLNVFLCGGELELYKID